MDAMLDHPLDLPLAVIVALILVREGVQLTKYLVARMNGGAPTLAQMATKLDLADAKAEILIALRSGQDELHGRISGVSDRVSHLEGKLGA